MSESKPKKKVALTLHMGMSLRNFYFTGIVKELTEAYEVDLLSISPHLAAAVSGTNPSIVLPSPNRYLARYLELENSLNLLLFWFLHPTETLEKYVSKLREERKILWWIAKVTHLFFRPSGPIAPIHELCARKYVSLLRSYGEIILLSFDVTMDKLLLLAARKAGVRSSVCVHSWDNLPARGFIFGRPAQLFVWNEEMVKQACELHGFSAKAVSMIGIPQYQAMKKSLVSLPPIETFFPVLSSRKYLTYFASASRVFPDEYLFIDGLAKLCERFDLKLLLRTHPNERVDFYFERYRDSKAVVLNKASQYFSASIPKGALTSENFSEFELFSALTYHSLGVVNLASTTAIDAMVFERPVLCPAFNVDHTLRGKWNEASRWYKSTHFKPVVESGAVVVVENFAEVENWIRSLLRGEVPRINEARRFLDTFSPPVDAAAVMKKAIAGNL